MENDPPTILIEGHPPRIYERSEGTTRIMEHRGWYNGEQLDQFVREYAREKKPVICLWISLARLFCARPVSVRDQELFLAHKVAVNDSPLAITLVFHDEV